MLNSEKIIGNHIIVGWQSRNEPHSEWRRNKRELILEMVWLDNLTTLLVNWPVTHLVSMCMRFFPCESQLISNSWTIEMNLYKILNFFYFPKKSQQIFLFCILCIDYLMLSSTSSLNYILFKIHKIPIGFNLDVGVLRHLTNFEIIDRQTIARSKRKWTHINEITNNS